MKFPPALASQVVVGNMLRFKDMHAAAQGAAYMFFCFPVQGGLLEATATAALAAKQAGLKGVLNLSQWCARVDSHSPQSHRHGLSEAVRRLPPILLCPWLQPHVLGGTSEDLPTV